MGDAAGIADDDASAIHEVVAERLGVDGPYGVLRLAGLTNRNYLVTAGDLKVVVRLPGVGTQGLIDRRAESEITHIASEIGVDNDLIMFDPDSGIKVMKWIDDAETIDPTSIHDPANIALVADALHRLHTMSRPVSTDFDVFKKIPEYEALILSQNATLWDDYDDVRSTVYKLQDIVDRSGSLVLCHNDPLCENFVKSGRSGRMYLIDWEYAGMNDPMWDLADVIIEGSLSDTERGIFERAYFGREATERESIRISANMVLLDFLWSLWGMERGCYGEDLGDYADRRFARAKSNLNLMEVA